jgi:hypothetical protein
MDEAWPRLRFSWWWVAIAVVGGIAIAFTLWMRSDSDLAAADARARSLGVSTTWAERGLVLSPVDQLNDWNRIHQLGKALRSYRSAYDSWRFPPPGSPLPPELAAHHAALPAKDLLELSQLAGRIVPTTPRVSLDISTLLPEIESGRELSKLYQERTALAAPDHVAICSAEHLALICADPAVSLIQGLVANSRISIWTQGFTWHLNNTGIDRRTLAAQCDTARLWLEKTGIDSWVSEYIVMRDLAQRIVDGDPKYASGVLQSTGMPGWMDTMGLGRPMIRLSRGQLLAFNLDMVEAWSGHATAAGRVDAFRLVATRMEKLTRWDPRNQLVQQLGAACGMVARSWAETDTQLRLLAAELRGEPWPIDPTDPAGKPVRRIERSGRLIGFYLLKDGADDGGHTGKDKCTALYEALGKPMAADPLSME